MPIGDFHNLPGLDEGRPKQTAKLMVHPEKTNLDEFLRLMSEFLNRARRGEPHQAIRIVIDGNMQPVTELQQHWNGDTMEVHMDVIRYRFENIPLGELPDRTE